MAKGETQQRVAAPACDHTTNLDLLRTCRQIYSETAALPYSKNVYCFRYWSSVKSQLNGFKQYQLANITHIQVKVYNTWDLMISTDSRHNLSFLPALKRVRLVMFGVVYGGGTSRMDHSEEITRKQLEVLLDGRNVQIVFEYVESFWTDYVAE